MPLTPGHHPSMKESLFLLQTSRLANNCLMFQNIQLLLQEDCSGILGHLCINGVSTVSVLQ